MLWLYWRVAFGTSRNPDAAAMPDLSRRELALLVPIAVVVLWMGVYPESFLAPMRKDVGVLLDRVERANPPGDSRIAKSATKASAPGGHESAEGAH
jgi:NADH-quinone oxidoreductase subunit M